MPKPTPRPISPSQARRIAIAAQGLDRSRERGPVATTRQVHRTIDRLGLLQIDSVNIFARAHLMPLYSRLGPYDPGVIDRAAGRNPRRLVEAWAHVASFVPPETYVRLRWRQEGYRKHWLDGSEGFMHTHAAEIADIRAFIRERGPVTAREVQQRFEERHPRAGAGWWDWSVAKEALERLFFIGELTSAGRTNAFERRYDFVERVLPRAVLEAPEPSEDESLRFLVEHGTRALGIATVRSIADYFRLKVAPTKQILAELIAESVVEPVRVEGWSAPAYLHYEARIPRRVQARALLSPFDPLVWERDRLLAMFGMHYRIEIYTPEPKRVYGYYVLPFLLDEQLAARVDLKADRATGVLWVQSAWREPGAPEHVAAELAEELVLAAHWQGLSSVAVASPSRGDLVAQLAAELSAVAR